MHQMKQTEMEKSNEPSATNQYLATAASKSKDEEQIFLK